MKEKVLPLTSILPYACIVFPLAFASFPLYMFLPEYYHNKLNVTLVSISISLFIIRLINAAIDPFIGYICDRFAKKNYLGLSIAAIIFVLSFIILYVPFFKNNLLNLIIGVFCISTSYSYFSIYVNTRGALWKSSRANKSKIIIVREILAALGVVIALLLLFCVTKYFANKLGLWLYITLFLILFISGFISFFYWLKRSDATVGQSKVASQFNYKLKHYIKAFDRSGVYLYITYALCVMASAIGGVMFVFYTKYVLVSKGMNGLYLFLYFLAAVLSIYFVRPLAIRFGSIRMWLLSLIYAIVVFSFALMLNSGEKIQFSVIIFLLGLSLPFEVILPNLLLAQWIDQPARRRLGNGYYSWFALIEKLSFAIAIITAFPLLHYALRQTHTLSVFMIASIYCLIPILLKLFALASLIFWLKDKKCQKVLLN
ncbi:MFS transporter [Thiotrichales bacterium 19S3-7]|nr:MFS transporter [Thiotrichales bacterium 19S3-7]MCF6802278.1 MFS transporter [Thiotrichales bacterium 19S3-11]